jgi:hypothetical protein
MARLKTKPVALASAGVALASKFLLMDRFRKAKPKRRRIAKAAKIAIPSLLALGAGGTLFKLRKGGARKGRNFSLVGGAGQAPTNNQTRPGTPAAPPATEASAKK